MVLDTDPELGARARLKSGRERVGYSITQFAAMTGVEDKTYVNSAKNILAAGTSAGGQAACGEVVRHEQDRDI